MNTVTSRQRGMSVTSWIFIIAVVLFFSLLGMKMVPSYMEFYSIGKILESVKQDRSMNKPTHRDIRKMFDRRININSIYDFDPKSLKISRGKGESQGKTVMEVEYEVRKTMAGNVDVVMSFYKKVEK